MVKYYKLRCITVISCAGLCLSSNSMERMQFCSPEIRFLKTRELLNIYACHRQVLNKPDAMNRYHVFTYLLMASLMLN
jgi:hypothetical protein